MVFLLLCSSDDVDDDCRFFGFLVSVDVGDDVDNESVGVPVPIRSIFCIAIVLLFFGDPVLLVMLAMIVSVVDGDASILLFNKGHP